MKPIHAATIAVAFFLPALSPSAGSSATAAQNVVAEDSTGDRQGSRGRWLEELGVSADQKAKIQEIRQKKHADTEKHRDELTRLHEELKAIMAGDGQAERAREIHKQMQEIQRDLGDIYFESMLSVRDLLTPEQRARFVETMKLKKRLGFGAK